MWGQLDGRLASGGVEADCAPPLDLPAPPPLKSLQESWALVKGRMDAIGLTVLARLFARHPEKLQLFSGFRDDPNFMSGRSIKASEDLSMTK